MAKKRQTRVVIDALKGFTNARMTKLSFDVVANLVSPPQTGYGTPVDTGLARSSWVVLRDPTAAFSIVGIRVSNDVPYIVYLNEGSSRQAPRGFVQNAIAKAATVDAGLG